MKGYVGHNDLGQIREPCPCCDPTYHIHSAHGDRRFVVKGDCCQCGILCKCCEALFTIHKANKTEMTEQNADGFIRKRFGGFKELVSDADNYEITFPSDATPEDKLLLIGTAIKIDYSYYERK
jgi:hypothetical protein